MKRVPYFEPVFFKTYTADDIARCMTSGKHYVKVTQQLKSRYFAEKPDFTPTEQELKWGITTIDPESCYWTHFRRRLPEMLDLFLDDMDTNRAVITIDYPEAPPCFQSFQFKVNKNGGMDLTCFARSLDLENGLPVDKLIFWKAALEPLVQMLKLKICNSTITIISPGAHVYRADPTAK